jgi:hypothetical protein
MNKNPRPPGVIGRKTGRVRAELAMREPRVRAGDGLSRAARRAPHTPSLVTGWCMFSNGGIRGPALGVVGRARLAAVSGLSHKDPSPAKVRP